MVTIKNKIIRIILRIIINNRMLYKIFQNNNWYKKEVVKQARMIIEGH